MEGCLHPALTMGYIAALAFLEIKIKIRIWAVKV